MIAREMTVYVDVLDGPVRDFIEKHVTEQVAQWGFDVEGFVDFVEGEDYSEIGIKLEVSR